MIAGELVANLELLKGEEVLVSRSIRTRALGEGAPITGGITIVSIPLKILVQDSLVRALIQRPKLDGLLLWMWNRTRLFGAALPRETASEEKSKQQDGEVIRPSRCDHAFSKQLAGISAK